MFLPEIKSLMTEKLKTSFPVLSADVRVWVTVWVSAVSVKMGRIFQVNKHRKSPEILRPQDFSGCGGRIRTNDLRVMSSKAPVRYHAVMYHKALKTHAFPGILFVVVL